MPIEFRTTMMTMLMSTMPRTEDNIAIVMIWKLNGIFSSHWLHIFEYWFAYFSGLTVLPCITLWYTLYVPLVVVVFEQIRYTICATNKIILRNEQTDCCDVVSMDVSLLTIRTAVWIERKWWANRRKVFFFLNWIEWHEIWWTDVK